MTPAPASPRPAKATKTASAPAKAPARRSPPSSPSAPPRATPSPAVARRTDPAVAPSPPLPPLAPPAAPPAPAAASPPPVRAAATPQEGRGDFARSVYEVARKEVLQHVRTKRLLIIGAFFLLVLQVVTLVFPLAFDLVDDAPGGDDPSHENSWFNAHLNASIFGGLFAVQLLCIVLTADAVCSEWSSRTIFLLLSKPVSRTAFVLGKYLGSLASIMPVILGIYALQYGVMNALYAGSPTGEEVLGFAKMLLMLTLGAMGIAAVALFFSTLTRSNVMALVLSLLSAIIVFPLVSSIGDIMLNVDQFNAARDGDFEQVDAESWKYDWSHYATPLAASSAAPSQLFPDGTSQSFALTGIIPQQTPEHTGIAVLMGFVFVALFVGLSVLRVNRRNFE